MVAVEDESVAELLWVEMAVPVTLLWVPGLVTVTVLVMFQVKVVLWASVWVSVAVTVTEQAQAVVGVPLMTPPELMERPAGRPVAPNVTELPPVVSCGALMVRLVMAEPEALVWVPGLVTDRASTFQVRVIEPAVPAVVVPAPGRPRPVGRRRGIGRVDIGRSASAATTGIAAADAVVATATATPGVAAPTTASAGAAFADLTVSAIAAASAPGWRPRSNRSGCSRYPRRRRRSRCRLLRRHRRSRHRSAPGPVAHRAGTTGLSDAAAARAARSGALPSGAAAAAPGGHGDHVRGRATGTEAQPGGTAAGSGRGLTVNRGEFRFAVAPRAAGRVADGSGPPGDGRIARAGLTATAATAAELDGHRSQVMGEGERRD